MNEVKRYHLTETGLVEGESLGRLSVVLAADYDAAVEQIAQLEQLNVLGQETVTLGLSTSARLVAERDALQQRLTAADSRADSAITFVTRLIECAGVQPSIATGYLRDILDALKPAQMLTADHKCIECDSEYCHGVCVERGDSDDRLIGSEGGGNDA